MKSTWSLILLSVMLFLNSSVSRAQEDARQHIEKRYSIFFRVNRTDIDQNYLENGHVISTMINDIQTTLETGFTPDSLLIYASASPEGSYALNERLARQRATSAKDYILMVLPQLGNAHVKIESRPNDWSGVLQTARADESMPYRDRIIKVLTDSRITNKEAALRGMPEVFRYIRDNMLHKMRSATVTIHVIGKMDEFAVEPEFYVISDSLITFPAEGGVRKIAYQKSIKDDVLPVVTCDADWIENITSAVDTIYVTAKENNLQEVRNASLELSCYGKTCQIAVSQEAAEPVVEPEPELEPTPEPEPAPEPAPEPEKEKKPFYLAVRTNMLYDLALVPNIGLDIYLGKNFSLSGNWMYSWWKNDNIYWYWRTYGGDLGVRYWFGKAAKEKPLQGHHVGLYGQIITYDFELGGRGYLGDRWTYGGGVEYGYSLPVAKRLNIDFNLGFGYLGGEFKEYLPIDGHYVWQATKRRQYIGPTKAEISLVWQLGRGNINAGKGGKR